MRLPRIVGQGRALEIILTGRKVPAEECLSIGLCEYVTPKGGARAKAEELAQEIARFPQVCVRADRRSAIKKSWAHRARGVDSRMVQRSGSADRGWCRGCDPLQRWPRSAWRLREDSIAQNVRFTPKADIHLTARDVR